MSADKRTDEVADLNGLELSSVMASRRLMLRRSLGAVAPVVATLVSGPVSAQTCINASGWVSAATYASRHPNGEPPLCEGVPPSGLVASNCSWGSVPKDVKFNSIFASGQSYKLTKDRKVMQVLQDSSSKLPQYVCAAYLNAMRGSAGYVVTAQQAVNIWRALCSGGTYTAPGLSKAWTQEETLKWLEMSW